MGLTKRGDTWWIYIRRKNYEFIGSTGCSKKEDAQLVLEQKMSEARAAKHGVLRQTKDITIAECANLYREKFQTKIRSWEHSVKYYYKRYTEKFGTLNMQSLTPEMVQRDYDERLRSIEVSSANREITFLRSLYSWAIKRKLYTGTNPVHEVEQENENPSRKRILSKDEFLSLLTALTPKENDTIKEAKAKLKARDIVIFAINTGFIESEIRQIVKSKHFNKAERLLWVQDGKTANRAGVYVKLNEYAFRALDSQIEDQPWDYCWRTVWRKAVEECKFNTPSTAAHDKVVFYTLRHTFCSWLLMAGKDIYTVAKLARNTVAMIERNYGHLSKDFHGQAVGALDNMMPSLESVATKLQQIKKPLSAPETIEINPPIQITA